MYDILFADATGTHIFLVDVESYSLAERIVKNLTDNFGVSAWVDDVHSSSGQSEE